MPNFASVARTRINGLSARVITATKLRFERRIALSSADDNALYLRATFENGSVLWTSPIYLLR